jgi:hypothetical protein
MSESKEVSINTLPTGKNQAPVAMEHFPDPLHAVIWRNWDLVPVHRLAEVLGGTIAQLEEIAHSMGLEKQGKLRADVIQRSYVTLIRRNWHLLPYEQLCKLLGWNAALMVHTLQEDDFLWIKLGNQKPKCESVVYRPPSAGARQRASWIAKTTTEELGASLHRKGEPPLKFIDQYASKGTLCSSKNHLRADRFELRMVYPYFLRYGDPLTGSAIDDVPETFLNELTGSGVNAIWIQGVLPQLAPWKLAPHLSAGSDERLKNLNRLADRAEKFGIGVYLYMNEPRSMPSSFFEKHPDLRGVPEHVDRPGQFPGSFTLCTSTVEVQEFIVDSVEHVFRSVPKLAGAFTITFSENLTNCYSRSYDDEHACARCRARGPETVIAEVNELIDRGMKRANAGAKLLVYDWAWPEKWVEGIIRRLPKSAWLMRVSEWGKPFQRGDFNGRVGEYSISVVGPSDESVHHWQLARKHGLKTVAKIQLSNSWELSSVHYVPAMRLVAEHLSNLCRAEVDGLMLGWTLGGLPCLNFQIMAEFLGRSRDTTPQAAMSSVAEKFFGTEIAPQIVRAWDRFSDAFAEFPFDLSVVYFAPLQMGPANLLYDKPTGYAATMCGIPYDDLLGWRGPYSAQTLLSQFTKVAVGFREGIAMLAAALKKAPSPELSEHLRISEAAAIHFQAVANQIQFIQNRGGSSESQNSVVRSEIDLARRMCDLVADDSRIGFEATNHYFYTRTDLIEKMLNCRYLLENPIQPS